MTSRRYRVLLVRICCSVALCMATFVFPWTLVAPILLAAIFYFDRYGEAVLIVLLYASVYGDWHVPARSLVILAITIGLVFFVPVLKERLRISS